MKNLIVVLCVIAFCFNSIAQTVPMATIQRSDGLFDRDQLVINGQPIEMNWHGVYDIGTAMDSNPNAKKYVASYNKFKEMETWLLWGGLGAALTYLAVTPKGNYSDTIYWGIFGGGLISAEVARRQANINLENAVDAYNHPQASTFQLYFSPALNFHSAGVVVTF